MKSIKEISLTVCVVAAIGFTMCGDSAKADKTGKAGDNLDLYAVLNLLEKSSSPEAFEKSLNDKTVAVNNLDLNEDGETDYIRVEDKQVGDAHVFVLQIPVESGKAQDVAVIEIEKKGEKEAHIQIIGDEALYGKDFIVEPAPVESQAALLVVATTETVNVWAWPFVTYVYSPAYVVYASPYRYEYYPVYWEPWPVVTYDVYYPVVVTHHKHYHRSDGYRFVNVHEHYNAHYRTTTHFVYSEKNHGVKAPKGHGGNWNKHDNGNDGGGKKNDNGGGSPGDRTNDHGNKDNGGNHKDGKGGNNDKHDQGGSDKKNDKGGSDNKKNDNGGNDNKKNDNGGKNKSPGNDQHKSPDKKQDNKQSPKQPSGGNNKGGGKGGKHK
ncbi:MAG TPA: hypothetical protein VK826_14100 [Bacteroidia bacterium]|nr:hypothetical protein [Bacteroidia bacterium]